MDDATTPFPVDPAAEQALRQARRPTSSSTRSAAKRLGFATRRRRSARRSSAGLTLDEFGLVTATIVGVVRDARFRSVRDPLEPIMFLFARNGYQHDGRSATTAGTQAGDPRRRRAGVEAAASRRAVTEPSSPTTWSRELYERDEARGQLFAAFALLAVVIGCLGLFGLAAFTAERRTKEIGIRKVLGARSRDIVRLLAWQFSKPVIIANLIAWPVAWWVMRDWLNGFDSRIALGPTPFILAGALALAIALGTIAGHAFRVARANPIQALRYE